MRDHDTTQLDIDRIRLDLEQYIAYIDNQRLPLTAKEFEVLAVLARAHGDTVSKPQFMEKLYKNNPDRRGDEPDPKIILVFICKIRRKIKAVTRGPHFIERSRGRDIRSLVRTRGTTGRWRHNNIPIWGQCSSSGIAARFFYASRRKGAKRAASTYITAVTTAALD